MVSDKGYQRGLSYGELAWIVILISVGLACLNFRDYGITNDEEVQNIYGKMVLSYYASSFHDLSALSYKDLFYYGGLFDFAAALINLISPLGEYETRHLLGGLVGVLGLIGTWRLARLIAGERAGFLALLLLALTPSFYGPSFNNPKDIPFAVGMVWTLLAACKMMPSLPRPPFRQVAFFAVCLGLTLGVRVGGGLDGIYLVTAVLLYLVWRAAETGSVRLVGREARMAVLALLPGLPIAYGVMVLFWPWAYQSPLNPLVAIAHFSHYGINLDTLMDGEWLPAQRLPALYLPLYLLVKMPEIELAGIAVAAVLPLGWLLRRRAGADRARVLQIVLVVIAALFPLAFFIIERPTIYNGIRHFEFVLPPLAVLAGIGLQGLWLYFERGSALRGKLCGIGFGAAALIQVWIMASLHPDEYVFFNQLAGGVKGADGKFELDYWGNSLAEAVSDLRQYVELENGGRPVGKIYKVAVCGNHLAVTYHLPPFLRFTQDASKADFFIGFTQHGCDQAVPGREIAAVERFGADLSVVKDLRHAVN